MIVGVGVDLVSLDRFAGVLDRTPGVASRVLTAAERQGELRSQAAAFAAKEAVAKALGAPMGLRWHDVLVEHDGDGRPYLSVRGTVAAASDQLGVTRWHVSLSHDGGFAIAMVVAESADPAGRPEGQS